MNKLAIAAIIAATAAAAVPANAAPIGNVTGQSTNKQCFKTTDSSRGFGYWSACEKNDVMAARRGLTILVVDHDRGSDGGGGDGGGGGGGGR